MYSKADTHIHTTYSDGLMSPEDMIDHIARRTDLRVIAITDHDTTAGAFVAQAYARRHAPQLDVIIGQEVTTREGDVVGLYMTSTLPPFETAAEAVEAIHSQNGLAIAVHPFSTWMTLGNMRGLGSRIFTLPLDGVEVHNGFPGNFICNPLSKWLNRYRGQHLPALGGSDSHVPHTVGQGFTWFPGSTAADLRQAIETNTIRAGGSLWTIPSLIGLFSTLSQTGFRSHKRAFSE
jgi:hypothetical protein